MSDRRSASISPQRMPVKNANSKWSAFTTSAFLPVTQNNFPLIPAEWIGRRVLVFHFLELDSDIAINDFVDLYHFEMPLDACLIKDNNCPQCEAGFMTYKPQSAAK
jgi:hypothetical protein